MRALLYDKRDYPDDAGKSTAGEVPTAEMCVYDTKVANQPPFFTTAA